MIGLITIICIWYMHLTLHRYLQDHAPYRSRSFLQVHVGPINKAIAISLLNSINLQYHKSTSKQCLFFFFYSSVIRAKDKAHIYLLLKQKQPILFIRMNNYYFN